MTAHLPPALLFDMDDTILTDSVNGDRCWQAAFEELAERTRHLHAETRHLRDQGAGALVLERP